MGGVIQGTEFLLVLLGRLGACLFNVSVKKGFPNISTCAGIIESRSKAFGISLQRKVSIEVLIAGLAFGGINFHTAYVKL